MNKIVWYLYIRLIWLLFGWPHPGIYQGTIELHPELEEEKFRIEDCVAGYHRGQIKQRKADMLNENYVYLRTEDPINLEPLRIMETYLNHPFRIVNVRFWKSLPSSKTGPNEWHKDGMPSGIRKVLVYLNGASEELGSTEIYGHGLVEGPKGTWLLFDNNNSLHRGIPPQKGERVVCEVTIAPAFKNSLKCVYSGQNASFPLFPWSAKVDHNIERALIESPFMRVDSYVSSALAIIGALSCGVFFRLDTSL